jgi:hypothetical protein
MPKSSKGMSNDNLKSSKAIAKKLFSRKPKKETWSQQTLSKLIKLSEMSAEFKSQLNTTKKQIKQKKDERLALTQSELKSMEKNVKALDQSFKDFMNSVKQELHRNESLSEKTESSVVSPSTENTTEHDESHLKSIKQSMSKKKMNSSSTMLTNVFALNNFTVERRKKKNKGFKTPDEERQKN